MTGADAHFHIPFYADETGCPRRLEQISFNRKRLNENACVKSNKERVAAVWIELRRYCRLNNLVCCAKTHSNKHLVSDKFETQESRLLLLDRKFRGKSDQNAKKFTGVIMTKLQESITPDQSIHEAKWLFAVVGLFAVAVLSSGVVAAALGA